MIHIATQHGLPQGGGLSPTLWSMVADSLVILLNKQGGFAQGFADDGVIIIIGKVLSTLCEIMQRILFNVESWCSDTILFTRKYKADKLSPITFYGKDLILSNPVKYLGVILDPKLNWQLHLDAKCNKAIVSFYQLRGSIGKTWGITPKITRWMYTAVIRPSLSYASLVWWPRVDKKTAGRKLEHVQRLACLHITGAIRTTPTRALEIIVGLKPLIIFLKQETML